MDSGDSASLVALEAKCANCHGYEFEWGQIIEDPADQRSNARTPDSVHVAACWHFVLIDLHNAFLDAGGNLGELSDLAVDILEQIR